MSVRLVQVTAFLYYQKRKRPSGVAKGWRSAPGGTLGYAVGYKPVQAVLK